MASQPELLKPITAQIVNEHATLGPLDLSQYFQADMPLTFRAELDSGAALPKGLICTSEGIITGIPAVDTTGDYQVIVTAMNDLGTEQTQFSLSIKPSLASQESAKLRDNKSKIWEALSQGISPIDLEEILALPLTAVEIYYLVQQFATLTIWDAYNLDVPNEKQLLTLEGSSPHFNVYDRGCCLVASPKDLFSHERTLEDALKTARAMIREAYKRGWTIELVGFDKMMRAAWVEAQLLGNKLGKPLEILHYNPRQADVRTYNSQVEARRMAAPGLQND
ncbi:hypothetical protein AYO45_04935 [Gammaproteobacteria bacterium SCGC AG-212-F23]|nr:hypothetical protein AYO45_04935 [Gammaproteobacteria bacterium SCGC AG-212-F23]